MVGRGADVKHARPGDAKPVGTDITAAERREFDKIMGPLKECHSALSALPAEVLEISKALHFAPQPVQDSVRRLHIALNTQSVEVCHRGVVRSSKGCRDGLVGLA